ncbi:uncharacterized protein isoform X3 [Rhodnius prolixus]|uniref:Centrosome-associated protein 350 n=1 Tax=Rhodnius prolixus TaxID=13249 RepID=A0A905QWW7_RHOPR
MERHHEENKVCLDFNNSERDVIEAQKKWIENSRTLTNISILEAQRHWINETITEKEFAESLLAKHDESIELNNYTLLSSHSKELDDLSTKEPCPSEKVAEKYFEKIAHIEESQDSDNTRISSPKIQDNQKNADHIKKYSKSPVFTQPSNKYTVNKSLNDNEEAANGKTRRFRSSFLTENSIKNHPKLSDQKDLVIQSDYVKHTGDSETSKNGCPYDKEEMRKFIKQRQKERYEKIFQENRLKENEKKEKIKKLELLKQTQKKIIDNSKMRCPIRSMDKPQWIGPMEGASSKTKVKSIVCSIPKLTDPHSKPQTGEIIFKPSAVNGSHDKMLIRPNSEGFRLSEKSIAPEKFSKTREKSKSPVKSRPRTSHHCIETASLFRKKTDFQNLENANQNFRTFHDSYKSNCELNAKLCDACKNNPLLNDQCWCKCEGTPAEIRDKDFSKVTRKRRSSNDDLAINDSQLSLKIKKLPPTLNPMSKDVVNLSPRSVASLPLPLEQRSKKSFNQSEECLDCIESAIWRKSSTSRKSEYSIPEVTFKNMEVTGCDSDLPDLMFENLEESELNKDGLRLEFPASSSSCQTESVDAVEFNIIDKNYLTKEIDQIENRFRLDNESDPANPNPLINYFEYIENISEPVFPSVATSIDYNSHTPDLSKVNTRRSTTSNPERETSISESLSIDPLRLSASIDNINLVTTLVKGPLSKCSKSEEGSAKESLLHSESEDEFFSKCASRNSNITQLIKSIPETNENDDLIRLSVLQEEERSLKLKVSQNDSLEKNFLAKCESFNNNLSSIDILQKDRDDSVMIPEEIKKKPELVLREKLSQEFNETIVEQNFHNQFLPAKKESQSNLQISKNISLRVNSSEHKAQITKDSLSENCIRQDLDEPETINPISDINPEKYFQDKNMSPSLGSSSAKSDRQRNLCLHRGSAVLSNKKHFLPFESSSVKQMHKKGNKQKLHIDSSLSDQSSSYSEIVQVSRTLSRGSTVISEVSEVHTLSSQSVKYNSSSLQNRIKNEIQQLNRLEENISSILDTTRISPQKEKDVSQNVRKGDQANCSYDVQSVNSYTSCSIDQQTSEVNITDMVENKREFGVGLLDISDINGLKISTFSLEMLNDLLKDEDLKAEHHAAVMKMREKALIDRAKAEIAYLEMQKRELKEQGRDEEVRNIKKRQRGVVVRVDEEIQEIERIRKAEKNASKERKLLIQQQQQLLKLQLGAKYNTLKRTPSNNKVQRSIVHRLPSNTSEGIINYERGTSLTPYLERKTRELQEKENSLMARKKNIESIVAWKQRLDQEEKKVQEMEKLLALPPSLLPKPNKAIDRGTSPMRFNVDTVVHPTSEEISKSRMQSTPSQIATASHSDSETQNKEYNSDSFEQSSVISDQLLSNVTVRSIQNSILDNKRRKSMAALKVPLSPRVTILKRRHSSGSDDSILFSQNETLSEQSDMEVRVSALQQQLKMRKAELEKLRKEFNKSQIERLRAKEQSLINQIQAYDTYIEQVKQELQKECDKSDIKVMKPLIKQPKFSERKKSEDKEKILEIQEKKKETSDSSNISPSYKTSSLVEPVSEIIEHDSSETIDSIKTQLESRVFDSPDISISKEIDPESHAKSSDVLDRDVISGEEEYSSVSNAVTGEIVTEDIVKELVTEDSGAPKEILECTEPNVSEPIKNSQKNKCEEISPVNSANSFVFTSVGSQISQSTPGKLISSENKSLAVNSDISDPTMSEVLSQVVTEYVDDEIIKNSAASNSVVSEEYSFETEDDKSKSLEELSTLNEKDTQLLKEETSPKEEYQDDSLRGSEESAGSKSRVTFAYTEPIENVEISSERSGHSLNVTEMVSEIKEQLQTISNFLNEDQRCITASVGSIAEEVHNSQQTMEVISNQSLESMRKSNEEFSSKVSSVHEASQKVVDKTPSSLHSILEVVEPKNSVSVRTTSIEEQLSVKTNDAVDVSNHCRLTIAEDVHSEDFGPQSESTSVRSEINTNSKSVETDDSLDDNKAGSLEEKENTSQSKCRVILEKDIMEKVPENKLFNEEDINDSGKSNLNETSEVEKVEELGEELDVNFAPQEVQNEIKISAKNNVCQTSNVGNTEIIDLLQDSFEISDEIWKKNLENLKNEDTPLLTALQMERQKNLNIDYIWRDICDSCVNEATDAFITAFGKKKAALSVIDDVHKEFEDSQDSDIVGDNEGFWLGEELTLQTAREAEQLRLQQLQIEQEIEELEQAQEAVPYYYVREIPNKPPPPYTPPGRVAPTPEEILARVGEAATMLWEVEKCGGDVANFPLPDNYLPSQNDQPHRLFLFELAKDLYLKARPSLVNSVPAWVIAQRPIRPLPKISTKEDLLRYMDRQTKLVFGYEPRIVRENMIMKWSRKKRDQVDEILIRECQDEEQEWVDFTLEENSVKNQLADSIIDKVLEDAVSGLSLAFTKKFKDENIS